MAKPKYHRHLEKQVISVGFWILMVKARGLGRGPEEEDEFV